MNTKKFLLLMVTFLFIILLGVKNVFATNMNDNILNSTLIMSNEFKQILNNEGKFEVNSYPPTTDFEAGTILFEYALHDAGFTDFDIDISSCNSTYTSGDITYKGTEKHTVEIVYNYDEDIKAMVDDYISKIPANKKEFAVRDLEVVNFWVNGQGKSKFITNYSSELKEYFDYKNFALDARRGTSAPFVTARGGIANFKYNNTIYQLIDGYEVTAEHILYVPDETENTPEAIMQAAQKRIDDYIGDSDIELSYISTAWEYWINYHYENTREEWQIQEGYDFTIEEFEQKYGAYIPAYNSFADGFYYELGIEGINENDLIYILDIPIDENMGDSYELFIRRDSSKMINPTYKTSDASTDITILSDESEIPLDTMVEAHELTSGTEYERIVKLLNLTDNLTFDLNLYSNSLNRYVTQLTDGSFEVQIPIPEDFKGKELYVYYVGNSNEPEIFTVNIADGYAVFTTNHFSTYTLGYKDTVTPIKIIFDANGGKFGKETTYTINAWKAELYDTLEKPTRDGYTFKGYYTEKTGGTKFEMILNESGIDSDSIFYAQWEENSGKGEATEEIKNNSTASGNNPQTSDNILFFVGILFISVLGIIVTTKFKNR